MNQTTAIIGGGVAIVAIAIVLYVVSGDEYRNKNSSVKKDITIEDKTLTLATTSTPLTTEAIKTETPATKNDLPPPQPPTT